MSRLLIMLLFVTKQEDVLKTLSEIPNAKPCHGEASFGYEFTLEDGSKLVIGQTDDDISDPHLFWIKYYKL